MIGGQHSFWRVLGNKNCSVQKNNIKVKFLSVSFARKIKVVASSRILHDLILSQIFSFHILEMFAAGTFLSNWAIITEEHLHW